MNNPGQKRSAVLGNLALLLGSLLLCLGVWEGTLRLFHYRSVELRNFYAFAREFYEPDPRLGWRNGERFSGVLRHARSQSTVTTNSLGMRASPELSSLRGEKAVLVLGDSQTWGYGVDDREVFTRVLQQEYGEGIVVYNGGVVGYGLDQELILLQRLGEIVRPRLVVVAVNLNDLTNILHRSQYYLQKPLFVLEDQQLRLANVPTRNDGMLAGSFFKQSLAGLACLFWVVESVDHLRVRLRPGQGTVLAYHNWMFLRKTPDAYVQNAWELAAALLAAMAEETRRSGSRLLLVALPFFEQIVPGVWQQVVREVDLNPAEFDLNIFRHRLKRIARELKVGFLDPLPAFRRRNGPAALFNEDHFHFTAAGHRLMAGLLRSEIAREHLLEGKPQQPESPVAVVRVDQ